MLVVAASVRAAAAWAWDLVGSAGRDAGEGAAAGRAADRAGVEPDGGAAASRPRRVATRRRGLDALDAYFGRYLPQLVLTVIATPIIVLVVWSQTLSGLVLVIVLPLIPIFMVLIGLATEAVQRRQWQTLASPRAASPRSWAGCRRSRCSDAPSGRPRHPRRSPTTTARER